MYTKFCYIFIIKLNDIARTLGCSPIAYNKQRNRFHVSPTAYNVTFMEIYMISLYVILIFPYNIILARQNKDYQQFYYTIVVLMLALVGSLFLFGLEFKSHTACACINGIFLYLHKFKRKLYKNL